MKLRPLLLVAAGLLVASVSLPAATAPAAVPPAANTYTVNLSPGWKVGEKFGVTTVASQNMVVLITVAPPGQPTQPVQQQAQKVAIHLEADAEVLIVFPNGGLSKVAFTVKKFTGTDSDAPEKDVLPAGAKVVAEKTDGKKIFTVDGKPAATELQQFLSLAVELDDAKRTDQEIFGSQAPVAVGGTWPVNGARFAEEMKGEMGDTVTAKGTMKLDTIKGEGDTQVASVSGTVTLENIRAPFPPPFVTKTAEAKSELTATQPAAHKGVRVQGMKMTMKLASEGSDNGMQLKATMEMTAQTKHEITYR